MRDRSKPSAASSRRSGNAPASRRERERILASPRPFRASTRFGEALAIAPQALDFSFLWTGIEPNERTDDGVAIVTVRGPLEHHETWCWDSYEAIVGRVEAALAGQDVVDQHRYLNGWRDDYEAIDPQPARAVVLRIDSPGGEAAGATWAHRKIRSLRKAYGTAVYAYADEMACSAAYEIACAADEVWLPDTGTVGSIGVIATLFDRTKMNAKHGLNVELITSGEFKADNHADREIDDGIRARMQARVMALAEIFWGAVAKARGESPEAVAKLEAGVFVGRDAIKAGIADGVAGWDKFLRTVSRALEESNSEADASAA